MRTKSSLFFCGMLMAASGAASAQAPPSPATPPAQTAPPSPAHSSECAPMPAAPQNGVTPRPGTIGEAREPLGDRLARSDGVLCPPAGVDPQMHAPTPDAGNMPVIPPPGSPGGDPNVRPK